MEFPLSVLGGDAVNTHEFDDIRGLSVLIHDKSASATQKRDCLSYSDSRTLRA